MKWWIVLMLLGGVLALSGSGLWKPSADPGDITCGSDVMVPGDVCEETNRGVVTDTYTYEEKLADKQAYARNYARSGRWVQLGLGLGIIAIATVGIVLTRRRRARRPPTTADLHLQQQAAQPAHVRQPPPPQAPPWQPPPPQPPPYQQVYQPPQYQQPHQQYPDFGPRG